MATLRNRFIVILMLTSILITLTTCTYTWYAKPTVVGKIELCNPYDTMPQMVKIPVMTNAWQTVENCDLFNREKVAISMLVFYNAWRLKFSDPNDTVWNVLNKLMIDWSSKYKRSSGFSMNGNSFKDVRISGLTRTPSWIWVYIGPNDKVCDTSLVHELVHVSIWAIKGSDADPDHLGSKYTGWTLSHNILIQEVNTTLCVLGL